MARHGDTRSPSPVGSSYSSKRNRRDDDRYDRSRRDDGRSHRNRSRSRSPDVFYSPFNSRVRYKADNHEQRRYRDRDSRSYRTNRSRDRREDDSYRSGRRDRSRDRRERETIKDYRPRSRDRIPRRDDSRDRDRNRRRRDESTDSRRKGRREDSRERNHKKSTHEVCCKSHHYLYLDYLPWSVPSYPRNLRLRSKRKRRRRQTDWRSSKLGSKSKLQRKTV